MPEVNVSLTKWWHWLTAVVATLGPIVALLSATALWVDTRYMHREISDTRFIELQIKIVDGHIRDYHRLDSPSQEDTMKYNLDFEQLKNLQRERNRILGLDSLGLPE